MKTQLCAKGGDTIIPAFDYGEGWGREVVVKNDLKVKGLNNISHSPLPNGRNILFAI